MKNIKKYDISYLGEFMDKNLEREFFIYDMMHYTKLIGPVALIFGVIYMMFLTADYFAIKAPHSFIIIAIIRVFLLVMSVVLYLAVKKMKTYTNMAYMITAYELLAIMGYLVIIDQYEYLTLLLFFSVIIMTLAVYIIPNKLIYAQIISVFLGVSFFVLHAKHIEGMEISVYFKMIAYYLIIIIYCNIGAYITNFYKRKQFVDSRELLRVSITDSMTGIYNRAKFNEELNQWIDTCNRSGKPLTLALFDIDDFKRVNDDYGHLMGDCVIQNIASSIKKIIRNTDIFARWGGDEFVLLSPDTDINQAIEMVERISNCIPKIKYDKVGNITCSFGLVELSKNEKGESLLQRADILLYDAKKCGKNIVVSEAGRMGQAH